MIGFLLRGILVGLLFGVPAGAVGAMTVQRTWSSGVKAGLLTGLGSSVADCFYASVGAFGLTLISEFLLKGQDIIHCIGGVLILAMGIGLLLKKGSGRVKEAEASDYLRMFFSSFAVGITNPAAIITFLLAFSWFGITAETGLLKGILLVGGVFLGTFIWWGILAAATEALKKKAKQIDLTKLNKVFGAILSLLGAAVLIGFFSEISSMT